MEDIFSFKVKEIVTQLNAINIEDINANKNDNSNIANHMLRIYLNEEKIKLLFFMAKFVYCNKCPELYMKLRQLHKNPFDIIEEISQIKSLFEKECGFKYEKIHKLMNYNYDFKFSLNSFIATNSQIFTSSTILPYPNSIPIIKISFPPIFSKNDLIKLLTIIKKQTLKSLNIFTQDEIKAIENVSISNISDFIINNKKHKLIEKIIDKIKGI